MLYLVIHCTFVLFSLVLVAAAAIIVANKRLLLVVGCGVVGVGLFFSLVLTGNTLFPSFCEEENCASDRRYIQKIERDKVNMND